MENETYEKEAHSLYVELQDLVMPYFDIKSEEFLPQIIELYGKRRLFYYILREIRCKGDPIREKGYKIKLIEKMKQIVQEVAFLTEEHEKEKKEGKILFNKPKPGSHFEKVWDSIKDTWQVLEYFRNKIKCGLLKHMSLPDAKEFFDLQAYIESNHYDIIAKEDEIKDLKEDIKIQLMKLKKIENATVVSNSDGQGYLCYRDWDIEHDWGDELPIRNADLNLQLRRESLTPNRITNEEMKIKKDEKLHQDSIKKKKAIEKRYQDLLLMWKRKQIETKEDETKEDETVEI